MKGIGGRGGEVGWLLPLGRGPSDDIGAGTMPKVHTSTRIAVFISPPLITLSRKRLYCLSLNPEVRFSSYSSVAERIFDSNDQSQRS